MDFIRQEHGGWEGDGNNTFNVYFSRGDGNFDVVTPPGGIYQSDLRGDAGAWIIPLDYNGDGKTDFIRQEHNNWDYDSAGTFKVYVSQGDGTFRIVEPLDPRYQLDLRFDDGAFIIPGDYDGDGKADFIRLEHGDWDDDVNNSFNVYFGRGSGAPVQPAPVDQVTFVTTGLGGTVSIHYAPILSGPPASGPGKRADLSAIYVVDQYTQGDGRGGAAVRNVTYGKPSLDQEGRGFLGFDTIKETLASTSATTVRSYNTAFPYTGLVTAQTVTSAVDGSYEKRTQTYTERWASFGGHVVHQISTSQETFEIGVSGQLISTVKDYQRDAYGNPVLVHDRGNLADPNDDFDVCTTYAYDTVNWRLDYPAQRTVAKTCSVSDNTCSCNDIVEDTKWQYGDGARMSLESISRWESGTTWQKTIFAYDALGNPLTRTEPNGSVVTLGYDSLYQTYPVTETRSGGGLSLSSTFAFDPRFGARVGATDPAGGTRTVTLDGLGREVSVYGTSPTGTLALLSEVTWGRSAGNAYRRRRDYNDWQGYGFRVIDEYLDGLGRVYQEVANDGHASAAYNCPSPSCPIIVDRTFDMEGRVTRESLPHFPSIAAAATTTTYDDFGHATSVDGPGGKRVYQRAIDTLLPGGAVRVDVSNGIGPRSVQWHDARGRMIQQVSEGRYVTFAYDALGRRTRVSDDAGSQLINYDGVGRIATTSSPDRGTVTSTYDPGTGKLSQTQDSDGVVVSYLYDGLGRVTKKTTQSRQTVDYTYDETAYTYGAGRLTSVTVTPWGQAQPSQRYAFSYTADGRIASRAITLDGATYTISRTYDPAGHVTTQTYPDGKVLNEAYDAHGRVTTMSIDGVNHFQQYAFLATGQPTSLRYGNNLSTSYWYDERQRLISMQSVGILRNDYTWDDDNRVTQITDQYTPSNNQTFYYSTAGYLLGTSPGSDYRYDYDSSGNLVYKEGAFLDYSGHRVVSGPGLTIGYNTTGDRISQVKDGITTTYAYDGEHHLTAVTRNDVTVNQMAYDFEGQRVIKIDADGTKTHYLTDDFEVMFRPDGTRLETKYVTGPAGRVASITNPVPAGQTALLEQRGIDSMGALYDKRSAAGLLGYAGNRASLWSRHRHAPAAVAVVLTLALAFALSRLARRRSAQRHVARLRTILLPEATPWARRHPIFALTVPVVLAAFVSACGNRPVESTESTEEALVAGPNGAGNPMNGTYYFHQNHLGSSTVITDASGAVVARVQYSPYGEVVDYASPGTDMFRAKFTGKEWDEDSGLYYSNARYYDPATGRFITADTHLFGGREINAAAVNPYAYAGNNPVVFVDPSGHGFLDVLKSIGETIAGAFSGGMAVNGTWDITKWNWKSWKTWVGIVAGAATSLVCAQVLPKNFAGKLMESIAKNATNEGLRFLSDEGSSAEQFGINLGIGVGTDVAIYAASQFLGAEVSEGAGKAFRAGAGKVGREYLRPQSGSGRSNEATERWTGATMFELASGRRTGLVANDPMSQLHDALSSDLLYGGLRSAPSIAESWRSSATPFAIEPGSSVMLQLPQGR